MDYKNPLRVLDLGCGPGTASLACSAFFQDQPLEISGFEQNANIRKDAVSLWKKLAPSYHRFQFTKVPIPSKEFDLTIASYFLSELPFEDQIDLSTQVLRHSRTFIIIEPALRKTTRDLQQLRDTLLARKEARVLAPCLHQQDCPMLKLNRRDWCHFYIDWKCPLLIRQVDQLIGNRHDYLKMAYMIFRGGTMDHGLWTMNNWRVVSSPLISKGKKEFILCGTNGRLEKIFRLDRNRKPGQLFDEIKRGDVLEGKVHYESIKIRSRF